MGRYVQVSVSAQIGWDVKIVGSVQVDINVKICMGVGKSVSVDGDKLIAGGADFTVGGEDFDVGRAVVVDRDIVFGKASETFKFQTFYKI